MSVAKKDAVFYFGDATIRGSRQWVRGNAMAEIGLKLVCAYPEYVPKGELERICKEHGVSSLKGRLKAFKEYRNTFEVEESDDGLSIRVKLLNPKALLIPCKSALYKELVPDVVYPDEVDFEETFVEGSVRRVVVNAYERNPDARRKCIAHYGAKCEICRFDFEEAYDGIVKGFIHVHHLRKLSEIGRKYKVDPIADLCPVCPNCHAIIHLKKEPYTIEEMRAMVSRARSRIKRGNGS